MNKNYIVYFELSSGSFRVWHSDTETIETCFILPDKISKFYMSGKQYEATDKDLSRYGKDIYLASEELKTSKYFYFDYITPDLIKKGAKIGEYYYKSHTSNIESIFKIKCKGKYEKHEPIDLTEYKWFEKSYNGGLIYTDIGIFDCYGYDFSNYYASILASDEFKIPTKPGTERKIEKLYNKIKFGFYLVSIGCGHPDFNKVFNYSPNNVYTSHSLKFALEHQEEYNVNITLITDVDKNCYIYDLKDLVSGSKIFTPWYDTIIGLKKEFPKNILIKMLSSSLWGHLSKGNVINRTEEEVEQLGLIIGMTDKSDYIIKDEIINENGETLYYKLLNTKNPYKYNLRLKPFITSFGRAKTAKMALLDIENVIRIHTDGIMFKEKQHFNNPYFIPEEKTTGRIELININNYKKL